MKSEDQDLIYSEKTDLNSQSSELQAEPVKEDTEPFSKPTDQILSSNDVSHYLIILISFFYRLFILIKILFKIFNENLSVVL